MPTAPEGKRGIIIGHTPHHVLWRVDRIAQSPKAEEAPRKEELEPDDVQIEVSEHAELERGESSPVRLGAAYRDSVEVM